MERGEIKKIIQETLEKIILPTNPINIDENSGDNNSSRYWFSVELDNPRPFLAREGEALRSLNHLIKKIIESNKPQEDTPAIDLLIDINGFQKKKVDNLRTLAHMMAERARYFKSNIEVDPMSAFDRKIVHEFLSDATDLKTESEGVGRERRVVIKYLGGI